MGADGRENVLAPPAALPRRALAGSAGAKLLEALTLVGLVLLVPRALGPADYGAFAVALALATGISTATGIGGPALFARVLGPLDPTRRRELGRALIRRLGAVRAAVVAAVGLAAAVGALLAPGSVSALQVVLVLAAVACGTAATLLSQLALGLERTAGWSLRYPLENGVIVGGAIALYPLAGIDGAIAAIALGAAAALGLGLATAGREVFAGGDDARRRVPESGGGSRGAAPKVAGAGREAVGPRAPEARAGSRPAAPAGLARGDAAVRRGAASRPTRAALPPGVLRFARLQAGAGTLTQVVHRGAAPACALAGVAGAATGHAAIAAGAALAITYAVTQTTLVALPGLARTFGADRGLAEAALRRVVGLAALVVVPACALLALTAEPLLVAGLGDDFRGAAQPLRITLAAAALAPLWALSTQLAALRGQPEAVLAGAAAGALTFVTVAGATLQGGAANAAAAAMLAGVAATVAGTFAALRRAPLNAAQEPA